MVSRMGEVLEEIGRYFLVSRGSFGEAFFSQRFGQNQHLRLNIKFLLCILGLETQNKKELTLIIELCYINLSLFCFQIPFTEDKIVPNKVYIISQVEHYRPLRRPAFRTGRAVMTPHSEEVKNNFNVFKKYLHE